MKKTTKNLILNLFFFLIIISSFAQEATEESNAILLKQVEEGNKRLKILRTQDSLYKIMQEQSGDINSATSTTPKLDEFNDEYAKLGNADLNQDMSQQPKAENADEINRSDLSKFIDSIPPAILYFFLGLIAILTIKFIFGKKG